MADYVAPILLFFTLLVGFATQAIAQETTVSFNAISAPAPADVLEGSCVDVSFLEGMLVDKFVYHLLRNDHQSAHESDHEP